MGSCDGIFAKMKNALTIIKGVVYYEGRIDKV